MTNLVYLKNGHAVTTSLQIAEFFDKEHKNIIRSINSLIHQLDQYFNELNFEPVKYFDAKGEERISYNLTRDAFVLLAMGFTGSKALQFKLAYLNAFNEMEKALTQNQSTLIDLNSKLKDRLMTDHLRYRQMYRYLSKGLNNDEIARCMQISTRMVRKIKEEMRGLELLPEQEVFVFAHTGKIARAISPVQFSLGV